MNKNICKKSATSRRNSFKFTEHGRDTIFLGFVEKCTEDVLFFVLVGKHSNDARKYDVSHPGDAAT